MIRLLSILFTSVLFLSGYFANVTRGDTLSDDETAIAANIKALHSENSDCREAAAKDLRRIIAKYSSGTSDIRRKDGGEAYWTEKVNQVVPDMSEAEVVDILPAFLESHDNEELGDMDNHVVDYRLDYHWIVSVQYRNPDKVVKSAKLVKSELSVFVAPPKDYTGTWICWYVNGQKRFEVQFKEGKYGGVYIDFWDNGQKAYEHHFVSNVAEGPDTGWYADGKISLTGQYKDGKRDGQWLFFYRNGNKVLETNYKNGRLDGRNADWFESGQMRWETNFVNGIPNGIESTWNEQGVLQSQKIWKNGKVVP